MTNISSFSMPENLPEVPHPPAPGLSFPQDLPRTPRIRADGLGWGPARPPPPAWQAVGVLGSRQRVPAPEEETGRGRKLRLGRASSRASPGRASIPPTWRGRGPEGSASSWWRKEREVAQSCLTLWDPKDSLGALPCSSIYGILQGRVLEWVAISFSRGFSRPRDMNLGLPHCRQMLYLLSHQGIPKLVEEGKGHLRPRVAFPTPPPTHQIPAQKCPGTDPRPDPC